MNTTGSMLGFDFLPLSASCCPVAVLGFWGELLARFVTISSRWEEIYSVAAVETGGKQQSTGLLHLMVQIWLQRKKRRDT